MIRNNLKKLLFFTTSIILLILLISGCNSGTAITLPGQTKSASNNMVRTIEYVQNQLDRPIKFYEISDYDPLAGRGQMTWRNNEVSILLNSGLDYEYQEAVAAHELAHILQNIQGYYGVEVQMNDQGQPVFPRLSRLATSINALVLDLGADNWASSRGFKVEEGLKNDFLPGASKSIDFLKESGYVGSFNWENYYDSLMKLAKATTTGEQIRVNITSEFATQRNAIEYAKWKLRLSPYGLFSELDNKFRLNFPGTWQLGNEIYSIVNEYGVADRANCNKTIIKVLEYLHLPYPLFKVRNIRTGEIILP